MPRQAHMNKKTYKRLMRQTCDIKRIDQSDESRITVEQDLKCTFPYPYNYRQRPGDSVEDVQLLHIYTDIPENPINESMRVVFADDDDEDFRIHSINKWPKVEPIYLVIILHGDGNG